MICSTRLNLRRSPPSSSSTPTCSRLGASGPSNLPCHRRSAGFEAYSPADADAHTCACAVRAHSTTPRSLRGAVQLCAATPRREVVLSPICSSPRQTDPGEKPRDVSPDQEWNFTCAFIDQGAPEPIARRLFGAQTPISKEDPAARFCDATLRPPEETRKGHGHPMCDHESLREGV